MILAASAGGMASKICAAFIGLSPLSADAACAGFML